MSQQPRFLARDRRGIRTSKGNGSNGPTRPRGRTTDMESADEVKLNPRTPIPIEVGAGAFLSINGGKYIPFLHPENSFANLLLEASLVSATQNACLNTKSRYMVGEGVKINNLEDGAKPVKSWQSFLKRCNANNQSLNRVLKKVFDMYLRFGNVPVEIVRGETAGDKFLYIYAKNFLDCRLSWPDKNDRVHSMLYTKKFRNTGSLVTGEDAQEIPLYRGAKDSTSWKSENGVDRTCIWLKNEISGYDHYGLPSSIAGLIYQVMEYAGARFNLDNLENGMVVSGAIFVTGNVSQEEADRMGSNMVRRYTGKGKVGRIAVFASTQGINDVKHVQYDTHKEGSYKDLNEMCESKIIFQNEWDAVLCGLKHANSLGKGGGYLKEIYEQKLKTVIQPVQREVIEGLLNLIAEIATEWFGEDWISYDIGIEPVQIDNRTSEASTTVDGLLAFLDIVRMVASGAYELDAAVQLVMACYGLTKKEAETRLGKIKIVDPNVLPQQGRKTGANNPSGNNPKDGN